MVGVVESAVVGVQHDAGGLAALAREAVVQDVGGVLGLDAGDAEAVVELAAGGALQRDDGDGGDEPEAEHPERVAGAAAAEAEQKCAHGSSWMGSPRLRDDTTIREALTCGCAGAESPAQDGVRHLGCGVRRVRMRRGTRHAPSAAIARLAGRGRRQVAAPWNCRRRRRCARRRPARAGSPPAPARAFGGDDAEHVAAHRGRGQQVGGGVDAVRGTGEEPPAR